MAVEIVKLPKAMLDHLEEQAKEYAVMKEMVVQVARALQGYKIIAVVTEPPSGPNASRILEAVNGLATLVSES